MSGFQKYWLEYAIVALAVVALFSGIAHRTSHSPSSIGVLGQEARLSAAAMPRPLPGKTLYSVDTVSSGRVLRTFGGMQNIDISVRRGDVVAITGWAVDEEARAAASAVMLQIDRHGRIDAQYGGSRPDVARVLGFPAFSSSGFTAFVSTARLVPGLHQMSLLIVDSKRTGYYMEKNKITLKVN